MKRNINKNDLDKYLGRIVMVKGKLERIIAYDDNEKCTMTFAVTSGTN